MAARLELMGANLTYKNETFGFALAAILGIRFALNSRAFIRQNRRGMEVSHDDDAHEDAKPTTNR